MKKVIDYESYIQRKETINTIGYDDSRVDELELVNVFYKGSKILGKSKKDKNKTGFAVNPITLVFKKTSESGVNLPYPTISSLRKQGISKSDLSKSYPYENIIFSEKLNFGNSTKYRDVEGLAKEVRGTLHKGKTSGMKISMRSDSKTLGHVNVFQLVEVKVDEKCILKEIKNVPQDKDGKVLGFGANNMDRYYKGCNEIKWKNEPKGNLTF